MTIIIFILILTVLVLIHEAGHFFVAKLLKIKVEEFGFGLPPKAIGKKIGETVYSINWLPIGGFVKLFGEDEAGGGKLKFKVEKLKGSTSRAFFARPGWQKALVVFAGVLMNFILSILLVSILFSAVGETVQTDNVQVMQVLKNSPAEKAGLKTGDVIEYLNGTKVTDTTQLIDETKKHAGEELSLRVFSDGKEKIITITPRKDYPKGEGPMGVAITQKLETKKYSWLEAPVIGTKVTFERSIAMLKGFGSIVGQLFSTGRAPEGVAGPVGIAQLTGIFCQSVPTCLDFTAILSLNLAIINLLPIPALDGGRLFFILFSLVTRKKVHPTFESYAHAIGMAILLALIALITFHDIVRILTGQPIFSK